MGLRKVNIIPGFDKQDTPTAAEGRYVDGDNVRFRYSTPEKIGGWSQQTTSKLAGVSRAMHDWSDLDGTKYVAVGTNKTLNLLTGDKFYDITPLANTVATCSLTSSSGSSTVTIQKTSHSLDAGQLVIFQNVTLPGGGATSFTADNFSTTNVFEIQSVSANSFNVVMASSESGSGMSSAGNVDTRPYEVIGPAFQTSQFGWGTGTWNLSTWGTARPSSSVTLDPGGWFLDNFGEILVATVHNGKSFSWSPSAANPLETRATIIANAPTASVGTIVSDKDRHLIFFGTETTIGNNTTQDKMFVRFSDQENFNEYNPTSTNTAGSIRLDTGTEILTGVQGKDYILLITDNAAYTMQFVGPPFTFSTRQVGTGCGIFGRNAAVFANGVVYWMGPGGFFGFDGTVKSLPCSVEDFVFKTTTGNLGINVDNGSQLVYAGHNSLFNEINWFYASANSTEINRMVTYNYAENLWTTGTLSRTSWIDAKVFDQPKATEFNSSGQPNFPTILGATTGSTVLYDHEVGFDELNLFTTGTTTTAISSFIRSGDFDLDVDGDGEYFMSMSRIIPDFKELNGTSKVTIFLRRYPNDTAVSSTLGPFDISNTTQKINTRARSRQASIKIESDKAGQYWKLGLFRYDVRPDGRR